MRHTDAVFALPDANFAIGELTCENGKNQEWHCGICAAQLAQRRTTRSARDNLLSAGDMEIQGEIK